MEHYAWNLGSEASNAAAAAVTALPSAHVEDVVWHYTDAEGLCGILEKREFHAGSLGFTNDASEFKEGRSVLADAFQVAREPTAADIRKTVDDVVATVLALDPCDTYAVSLSSERDQLGQWRAYGANGAGFALGFNLHHLQSNFPFDHIHAAVVYDPADARAAMDAFVGKYIEGLEALTDGERGELSGKLDEWHGWLFAVMAALVKNSEFRAEREYRMYRRRGERVDLKAVRGRVRPFVRFVPSEGHLGVALVQCGPCHSPASVAYLKRVLAGFGVDDVFASAIPYAP